MSGNRSALCWARCLAQRRLELNVGRSASGSWMPPLARVTPANSLSCDVMRLVMDCTDMDGDLLGGFFQNICMPRFCWRLAFRKLASKEILESVHNIMYHRWVAGHRGQTNLFCPSRCVDRRINSGRACAMTRHCPLQWKTDWPLMNARVHLAIRSRRHAPLFLASPRFV